MTFNTPSPPRGIIHKFIFDRPDRMSDFDVRAGDWKDKYFNFDAPHRPRQQQPGGQGEARTPPKGWGRDEVIFVDTFQCQHWPCTKMVKLPHGVRVGDDGSGWCKHCNGLICAACMRLSGCLPMEEGLYRFEQLAKIKERMSVEDLRRDVDRLEKFKTVGLISGPPRS